MLFDPSGKSDESGQDDGLAALDLLELPVTLYSVMRLMLRHVEMDFAQLWKAIEALPEAERLSKAEAEEALRMLIEQHWLVKVDGATQTSYRVNFRRKIANVRSGFTPRKKTGSLLPTGIWDALDANPKQKRLSLDSDDDQKPSHTAPKD